MNDDRNLTPELYNQLREGLGEHYKRLIDTAKDLRQKKAARLFLVTYFGDLKDWDAEKIMVVAAMSVGIEPFSEDYYKAIQKVNDYIATAAEAAIKMLHELAETVADVMGRAFANLNDTWEELSKIAEEVADLDAPDKSNRHDGAVTILTIWLPPTPNLKKLYGQGIDYGGPARPVRC